MRAFNKYIPKGIYAMLAAVLIFSCTEYDPDIQTTPDEQLSELTTVEVLQSNGFTLLIDALEAAGLTSAINDAADTLTIFAPNNLAFSNLLSSLGVTSISEVPSETLASILQYHVVSGSIPSSALPATATSLQGGTLFFNGTAINAKAAIISTDFTSANGRIHGINQVLEIPASSVYAAIAASPNHTLLAQAVDAAGLAGILQGAGSFTVLAPDDDAFTAAGLTTDVIAASTAEDLADILLFHVISGRIYSTQLPDAGTYVETLAGPEADGVQQVLVGSGPDFNDADVNAANINAENGVVHSLAGVVSPAPEFSYVAGLAGPVDNALLGAGFISAPLYGSFFSLMTSAGYDVSSLENQYTIYTELGGASDVSEFASNDEAVAYIESRMFDPSADIFSQANGTRVTSINGTEYFVGVTAGGTYYINGGNNRPRFSLTFIEVLDALFGIPNPPLYKGSSVVGSRGAFTPLPATNLDETIAGVDTLSLFSAALGVTGLDAVVSSGDHTIFAVSDATFSAATGYTSAADIDTLAAGDDNDASTVAFLNDVLSNHIVPNDIQFANVIATDLPDLATLSGASMVFAADADGFLSIIVDSKDLSESVGIAGTDGLASNGVIHVLDAVIAEYAE